MFLFLKFLKQRSISIILIYLISFLSSPHTFGIPPHARKLLYRTGGKEVQRLPQEGGHIMRRSPREELTSLFSGKSPNTERMLFQRIFNSASALTLLQDPKSWKIHNVSEILGVNHTSNGDTVSALGKNSKGEPRIAIINAVKNADKNPPSYNYYSRVHALSAMNYDLTSTKKPKGLFSERYQSLVPFREITFMPSDINSPPPYRVLSIWRDSVTDAGSEELWGAMTISTEAIREITKNDAYKQDKNLDWIKWFCAREGDCFQLTEKRLTTDPILKKYYLAYSKKSNFSTK